MMTYPRTLRTQTATRISCRYAIAGRPLPRTIPSASPQCVSERFSGAVAISPPIADHDVMGSQSDSCQHRKGQFNAYRRRDGISPHFHLLSSSPPNRGRELTSREAVLPLMYRVKEDGLRAGLHEACKGATRQWQASSLAVGELVCPRRPVAFWRDASPQRVCLTRAAGSFEPAHQSRWKALLGS